MTMSTPNDPELDALLGAYALDALDDDERARVEHYLDANPAARDEVDEMRESAAALALAPVDDTRAPADLWDKIATTIAEEPRNVVSLDAHRARRRPQASVVLAVAASIAVVVLLAQVVVLEGRDSKAGDLNAAFDHATHQQGARTIALQPGDGAELARVVLLPDGSGYFRNDGMQALPAGYTYQLWAVSGGAQPVTISAGVLGDDPHTVAFHVGDDVKTLGVTVEHAPGVVKSTQPMVASATVA